MTIRDRGTKKWTSLMLTEHVEQLRDYFEDEYYRVEKPEIDEQQLEEMNDKIHEAIEFHYKIHVTHYQKGHYQDIKGHIHYVNPIDQTLYIVDNDGFRNKVTISDILNIQILNE
ncbi:YolD-like family protein [Bacillus sp. M6-12]|uniref:YolD-like family protein n=1 Tax=Bacillus sp. M6-12 TaxID=2054166 RepID=UPI000C790211|nr:YolD-like family protein [Bacillus sp. M6-12]PLS19227.1 YolD-like family protein [Bacillus sp. M6-12]